MTARTKAREARPELVTWVAVGLILAIFGAYLFFTLSNASYTLGCDYLAYDGAARRLLAGGAPYDVTVSAAGQCGTFQYPPPFLALVVPLTALSPAAATWAWIAICIACVLAAIAILPVSIDVRLVTLALAGTSWPLLFAIKVGTVGPILLLVFAVAWRWRDRPIALAGATALGTIIKLQPALLVVWMVLTRRFRAAAITIAILGAAVGIGLLVSPDLWRGFVSVVRQVSGGALTVPANFAPASIAFFAGASPEAAQALGAVHTIAVLLVVLVASYRCTSDASLLVTAVASQVVSPVMWDHYAVVLFLPIAWLLARRQWWALLIGIGLNAMLILVIPPVFYIASMDAVMLALLWVGRTRPDAIQGAQPLRSPSSLERAAG